MASEPPTNTDIADVIAGHGQTMEAPEPAASELSERLDQVETLIEEMGRTAQLVTNLDGYISDLRDEARSIKNIRRTAFGFALIFIIAIDYLAWYLLFQSKDWFRLQEPYFKGTVIVAITTASVVLLSIILHGAFYSVADRHKDEMLPPHLKETIDAVRMVMGKGDAH